MNIVHAGPLEPPRTGTSVDSIGGIYDLFKTGLNWFFTFAILLAIIIFIFSGIQMMTAGGNEDSRKSALSRIYFTAAGVVIIFLAWLIVTQIIPRFLNLGVVNP